MASLHAQYLPQSRRREALHRTSRLHEALASYVQLRADRGGLGPSSCIASVVCSPAGARGPDRCIRTLVATRHQRWDTLAAGAAQSLRSLFSSPAHQGSYAGAHPRTLNTPQPCWQAVSVSLSPIARWVPSPGGAASEDVGSGRGSQLRRASAAYHPGALAS